MSQSTFLQIWTGRHVELEIKYSDGETEQLSLDLVPDSAADFDNGFLGESTPLAKAILGKKTGDVVSYQAGVVQVLSVSADWKSRPTDLSERREEVERKAAQNSDRTSVILFASSFNGKWGDYDPSALTQEDEPPDSRQPEGE